ncbi:hypothetical protein CGJ45_23410, partial [Vibrio parahaemolyticus]|uniref:hypothetical protein n=1 Tax=Vibrio parahaemolyticus TaxID=670 RepID=UPI0011682A64
GDGTLGKACVFDKDFPGIADGHVTIIRLDKKRYNPYYVADYLRLGFGKVQIVRLYRCKKSRKSEKTIERITHKRERIPI